MSGAARPLRTDAVRNRGKILDAAREQIRVRGTDVPMVDIARAAGVAVGTLYRHFPTKTDLIAAALEEFVKQAADRAEGAAARVLAGKDPRVELESFLRDVVDASAANHALKVAAASLGADLTPGPHELRAARALSALLTEGQRHGRIRQDMTIEDAYMLVNGAPFDQPPASRERWLDLVLSGIW